MNKLNLESMWLTPNWTAPKQVQALITLRACGDMRDLSSVQKLMQEIKLPSYPIFLEQVHENTVIIAEPEAYLRQADASIAIKPNQVCAILTADCLPILLCDITGKYIAAIHGGWRSLAANIIEKTIIQLELKGCNRDNLMVWFGPAIGPEMFFVGESVQKNFLSLDRQFKTAFQPAVQENQKKWVGNLVKIAKLQFAKLGINQFFGGEYCTYSNPETFFSYRRSQEDSRIASGRMATLIWMNH